MFRFITALMLTLAAISASASPLPDRNQIDNWLDNLGADGQFDARKGIDWGVMPGPFYTPELGPGIGAAIAGVYRPDESDKVSQNSTITISGYGSATGAFGASVENYGFYDNDNWRFYLKGRAANTPTYFWGEGFDAGRHGHNRQQYTAREFSVNPQLMRKVAPDTYLGLNWSLSSMSAERIQNRHKQTLANTKDGPSVFSSGPGVILSYDTRDFVPNPRRGVNAGLGYTHYSPDTGGDTRFDRIDSQLGYYRSLDDKRVLAWEANGVFTQGRVPWNEMPSLGSSNRMRGYYEGRYRDRNTFSTQIEYRQKLSWRHGIVGWLGAGTMSRHFHTLGEGRWLPTAGAGYRFAFKPGINVRLDYGLGRRSSGFYFQVGEAF
ncbi:membrane protein [Salmonella enterica subsp. enterica serovar Choleraesuis]|nr:membrane protein [Salmonella enterica subsp. enterica serovar Choleraesuis]